MKKRQKSRTKEQAKEYRRRTWKATPVDLAVLKQLPIEGSQLGLHLIGSTVPVLRDQLRKIYDDDTITSTMISGRLVSMKDKGYVTQVVLVPLHQGMGWQITAAGKELLASHNTKELSKEVTEGGNT